MFIVTNEAITPAVKESDTQFIIQRHCDYERLNGGLKKDSVYDEIKLVSSFMQQLTDELSQDELQNTYFLLIASDTESNNGFKRGLATMEVVRETIKLFCRKAGIPSIKIINEMNETNYGGKIKESRHLEEPRIFTDNKGFYEYLVAKHGGVNRNFWIDYEGDHEKAQRESLGSEGPDEIVDRGLAFLNYLKRYSELFHNEFPNSKLIIWCGSHYDLISPLAKREILKVGKDEQVSVDYCGGLSFTIDCENKVIVNLNGTNFLFESLENKPPRQHF